MSDTVQTQSNTAPSGNTKKELRARAWVFTVNNYTDEHIKSIVDTVNTAYVFQEEKGENGTPHLQGYIYFKSARKFSQVKQLLSTAHWEKCKSKEDAIKYCQKEETRNGRIWIKGVKKIVKIEDPIKRPLPKWQNDILELIKEKPDNRSIHWIVDIEGGKGKTSLAKHICMNYNALYTSGKSADIKYGVTKWIEEKGYIDIICIDLTRSIENYVSYQGIEEIKNGIFYNTKYESGMVIYNPPHVIIFSNPPGS